MTHPCEALLKQYLNDLKEFESILKEEMSSIESNELDDYDKLLARKHDVIQALTNQHKGLIQLTNGQPLEQYIGSLQEANSLKKTFSEIKYVAESCEQQNKVNGMLIIASKNINERLLDMMTNRNQNRTYSKHAKSNAEIESTKSQRI